MRSIRPATLPPPPAAAAPPNDAGEAVREAAEDGAPAPVAIPVIAPFNLFPSPSTLAFCVPFSLSQTADGMFCLCPIEAFAVLPIPGSNSRNLLQSML
jgi:hypothetical protein